MINSHISSQCCRFEINKLANSADLHLVDLDQLPDQSQYLDQTDTLRAEKMPVSRVKQRFINARGYLRYCLGRYLDQSPEQLSISLGKHGKPFLAEKPIFFNISHSQGVALMAFTKSGPCGVDIEVPRTIKQLDGIAERVFSNNEIDYLNSTNDTQQLQQRFYQLWTRKEAYIKMTGIGLFNELNQLTLTSTKGLIVSTNLNGYQLIDIPNLRAPAALCVSNQVSEITVF